MLTLGLWGSSSSIRSLHDVSLTKLDSFSTNMSGYGQGYYRLPPHLEDAHGLQPQQEGAIASSSRQSLYAAYPDNSQLAQYHQHPLPESTMPKPEPQQEKPEVKTPRPPNAWILYRSRKFRELQQSKDPQARSSNTGKTKSQAEISRIISQMWQNETAAVRRSYEALADEKKLEHQRMYPAYRYRPKKKTKELRRPDASLRGQGQEAQRQSSSTSPYQTSARVSPHRRHVQTSVYSGFDTEPMREGMYRSMPPEGGAEAHASSSLQGMGEMDRRRQERPSQPPGQWGMAHNLPPLMPQEANTSMHLHPSNSGNSTSYRRPPHQYAPPPREGYAAPRQPWEMNSWPAEPQRDLPSPQFARQDYLDPLASNASSHGGSQPDPYPAENQHFYTNQTEDRKFNYFA